MEELQHTHQLWYIITCLERFLAGWADWVSKQPKCNLQHGQRAQLGMDNIQGGQVVLKVRKVRTVKIRHILLITTLFLLTDTITYDPMQCLIPVDFEFIKGMLEFSSEGSPLIPKSTGVRRPLHLRLNWMRTLALALRLLHPPTLVVPTDLEHSTKWPDINCKQVGNI